MSGETIYEKIKEIFGESPGTLSILEEKVDIDLQMEYFEYSKSVKKNLSAEEVLKEMKGFYTREWTEQQKKDLFARLASLEKVEAYRFIESYLNQGHDEIRDWAILALQESRMLLESQFLDENQVFISTGLGGKGSKLRYFVVLIRKQEGEFTKLQQKIVRNEFEISLKNCSAEIEKLEYNGTLATLMVIIPLRVSLKETFREAIQECNQYGDFLKSNFIVTNVRELGPNEIEEFLLRQEQANQQNENREG